MFFRFPIFTIIITVLAITAVIGKFETRGGDFLGTMGVVPFVAIVIGMIVALLITL